MSLLDLSALMAAPLHREPFDYIHVPDMIGQTTFRKIAADFPEIPGPGLLPLSELHYGPAFAELADEIMAPALTNAFSQKFGIELIDRPIMVTVRGHSQRKDGRIHNDSESKVVSALIYLNDEWTDAGGRFRILNSDSDIDDFAAEVPPKGGTLVAFRRSENSFHGHRPFVGVRRYIMLNWMTDRAALARELGRHRLSAQMKRLGQRLRPMVTGR